MARGYFDDAEATRETFGGGWLRTGDLGYLVDGSVYICGRTKDLIIVNGRNYYPQDIEWIVDDVPEVRARLDASRSRCPAPAGEELVVVVESRTAQARRAQGDHQQRINEQLQLTVAEVVIARRLAAQDLERQAAAPEDARAVPRRTVGQEGNRTLGGNGDKLTLAKHVATLAAARAPRPPRRGHTVEIRSSPMRREAPARVELGRALPSVQLKEKGRTCRTPSMSSRCFKKAALEVNGKQLTGLKADTVISKLGLDSVAVMELVSYFEEKLSIRMPDEDLAQSDARRPRQARPARLVSQKAA